ncbi:MAG TPA: hypothetical protein PLV71_03885 [Chitinophagales bacterium]|nr:hypothetical protein [Chitinophagales bacterium]
MMQKHFLPILFITFLISFFSLSSCTYENMPIPDIEQYTIDTVMTPTDTSGYIYGRIYENKSEQGRIFEAYTATSYLNGDTILSISTTYKNQKLYILFNSNQLGKYTASPDVSNPMSCFILFDSNVSNLTDLLVNLRVGEIKLNSFDSVNNIFRGKINVSNIGFGTNTYDIRGDILLKINLTSFPTTP